MFAFTVCLRGVVPGGPSRVLGPQAQLSLQPSQLWWGRDPPSRTRAGGRL